MPPRSIALFLLDFARRAAPPVEIQPQVRIARWRFVRSLDAEDVHLCGFPTLNECVRLTTPIAVVNGDRVTTTSGRQYELVGDPASEPEDLRLLSMHIHSLGLRFEYMTRADLLADEGNRWLLQ